MKKQDFINKLIEMKINDKIVELVEKKYLCKLNDEVKRVLSFEDINFSINDESRLLSSDDILNADKKYDYEFTKKHLIPLMDCSDNDLLVYDVEKKQYSKFNIVDKLLFKDKKSISECI